jgi:chaperonin GroES
MPFTVREGDQVIFSTYSGTEVKIGDDEMLILSEDDILCVVE